jgi:hypothetical protein
MLSRIIPLVPPAAGRAEEAIAPRFFHVTVLSVVVAPTTALQTGTEVPDVPAIVTN